MNDEVFHSSDNSLNVAEFAERFQSGLLSAYRSMLDKVESEAARQRTGQGARCAPDNTPDNTPVRLAVAIRQEELHDHTHRIVMGGFKEYGTARQTVEQYLQHLHTADVKWTGAICRKDEAAAAALLEILQRKVIRRILIQFRNRECARKAAEDLPSRIFMPGESGRPRIEEFKGRSSLDTWLIGIGNRLAINECNRKGQAMGGDSETGDRAHETQAAPSSAGAGDDPDRYLNRLFGSVIDALQTMTTQQKLVFVLVYIVGRIPSETADCLAVSRARIAQILKQIREKIADSAADVIRDVAAAAEVDQEVVVQQLDGFLKHLKARESEPDWQPLLESDDALQRFLMESWSR